MEKQLEFDFVKDITTEFSNEQGFDEIADDAEKQFNAFMDHYKVPQDVREEIKSLATWF